MADYKVLVIDDEEDMRNLIEMYLLNEGYLCIQASNKEEALKAVANESVDMVLLDVMMPGHDGFAICKSIREISQVPIIFVSARGDELDRVKAMKLGGNDYVVKPFNPSELMARIKMILGRMQSNRNQFEEHYLIIYKDIKINEIARKVCVSNQVVSLTEKEYELLKFFLLHPNQVLSREQLLEQVWGVHYNGSLQTVDTHMRTIRMKLKHADYIRTVAGVGYRLGDANETKTI